MLRFSYSGCCARNVWTFGPESARFGLCVRTFIPVYVPTGAGTGPTSQPWICAVPARSVGRLGWTPKPVVRIVAKYGVPTVPFGRAVNESDRGGAPAGLMVIVTGPVAVCCGLELSVTVTVAVVGPPGVVGVPVTVHPVNVSPAGRAPPVIEQV